MGVLTILRMCFSPSVTMFMKAGRDGPERNMRIETNNGYMTNIFIRALNVLGIYVSLVTG